LNLHLPEHENSFLQALARVPVKVKKRVPLVHHITNYVVANDSANAMLAVGALPVMAISGKEVEEMVSHAQALVINLGTPSEDLMASAVMAGKSANAHSLPVVLDPVGAGATQYRTKNALRILREVKIGVLRANPGEVGSLLGYRSPMRGVEAERTHTDSAALAVQASRSFGCTVAITGQTDYVSDGHKLSILYNGHHMLTRVTGTGCLASSLCAAFAAVETDLLVASTAALGFLGVVAERAALKGKGPGSFRTALFDVMYSLGGVELVTSLRLEVKKV